MDKFPGNSETLPSMLKLVLSSNILCSRFNHCFITNVSYYPSYSHAAGHKMTGFFCLIVLKKLPSFSSLQTSYITPNFTEKKLSKNSSLSWTLPIKSPPSHKCNDLTKSNFNFLKSLHQTNLTQNSPNYFPSCFKT